MCCSLSLFLIPLHCLFCLTLFMFQLDVELLSIKQSPFGCVTWALKTTFNIYLLACFISPSIWNSNLVYCLVVQVSCQNRRRITQSYSLPYCHLVHQEQKQTTFSYPFCFDGVDRGFFSLFQEEGRVPQIPIPQFFKFEKISIFIPSLSRFFSVSH